MESKQVMKRTTAIALLIVAIIIGIAIGYAIGYFAAPPKVVEKVVEKPMLSGEIPIGGVFCLTGPLSAFAENEATGLKLAANDINAMLERAGVPVRIKLLIEDSELKPAVALEKLKALAAKGCKVTIGWLASSEVAHCKSYADANKILIISSASTSPALAIPDDYVFRLPPDDTKQGRAMARVMYDVGIRYIIPVWRGDAWGDGIEEYGTKRFKELGGTALEGIRYSPDAREFSAEVSTLASRVADAVSKYGKDKVGVYFIGFGEAVTFFTQAKDYPILSEVRWFGSDGTCLLDPLIKDPTAADFAVVTKHIGCYFAPTASEMFMKLRERLVAELGREPEPYAYNAYDALWLVVKSMFIVGKYDAEAIKAVLPEVAAKTFGTSGWLKLNPAGDRDIADYELWAIMVKEGKLEWTKVGYYSASTDSVTWLVPL
jgi:branched-chain amino acid transport system substrate-binding protein